MCWSCRNHPGEQSPSTLQPPQHQENWVLTSSSFLGPPPFWDLLLFGTSSSFLGPAPGQALGSPMFSPWGSRRGFPREPGPWQARPPLLHAPEPPWQHQQRRGRGGWCLPSPWEPRPFPGPENFYGEEEEEEEMRWAPHDCPPPWDDQEDIQGPEDWHMKPMLPHPDWVDWCEFPREEEHPLPPPPNLPRDRGGFQKGPSWRYHGPRGRRWQRLRSGPRNVILVPRIPWPSRGNRPPSKPPPPSSGPSQARIKEDPEHPAPPHHAPKNGAQRRKTTAQDSVRKKVPEPPRAADTPQKSPNSDSKAATEAAEPEQGAGATLVKPGAGKEPEDTQSPSASEPAPPEESSARLGEHPEVEPCSQSVPKAGAGAESHPDVPTTTPEPAEGGCVVSRGVAVELCLPSQGQQQLQSGAGDAEAEAAQHQLLGDLQLSKKSQVPPEAAAEPKVEPSQAGSDVCTAPETSLGTQHPPGAGEKELAVGGRPWLCSTLPTSLPAGTDLRSAAILARKEEIELSYQQFSLTIAVVATMLLAKEPSMEGALGLALRANLRQGRIHHLQELEDFINSYDSATLSP
ncbi:basic salivary proline-rich protein 1-like [Heliangelus exortis]|uniref:basic salivary proline-rich protein 1-like n=1 Tax=Heliangelus exortis TaxID=472823 RepID=UPI003A94960C